MSKLFAQHPRTWKQNRFVYPVVSRRSKGLSIGINLNPDKACNFDCIYCSVDRSTPGHGQVDLHVARWELDHLLELSLSGEIFRVPPFDQTPPALRRVNDVAFSGDGEPTSYPRFAEACKMVIDALKKRAAENVKIVVITNATLLDRPKVRSALELLDEHHGEIWAKLDAGTEQYYRQVERTRVPFRRVLDNITAAGQARPIVVQSMFLRIDGIGPDANEIEQYIERLRELRSGGCQIKLVQVYTVARVTAEANISPLDNEAIDGIAARIRGLGIAAESFYGPS